MDRFGKWVNLDEASFWQSLGLGNKQITDAEALKAAQNFVRFLKQYQGIDWDNSDQRAGRLLVTMVKSVAMNQVVPARVLIDITNSINKANQHKFTPRELVEMYWQAHQLHKDLFPFPAGVKDPQVVPLDLESAWERSKAPSGNNKTKPYMAANDAEETARIDKITNDFKAHSGFNPKNNNENHLLELLIKYLLYEMDAPWENLLRKVYKIYRTNHPSNPSSAVEFIEPLIHRYHFRNYREVLAEAQKIDDEMSNTTPPQPPKPPGGKNLTPEEKVIEKFITHVSKHFYDPKANKTDYMTIDDWRKLRKGSAEYQTVLNVVHNIFRGQAKKLAEFSAAL